MRREYKMLGVVAVYNPDTNEVVENIKSYAPYMDKVIIWDNSSNDSILRNVIMESLNCIRDKILWEGIGQNRFIAPAINFAWNYARENGYDYILTMDQDSRWADFSKYRHLIEEDAVQGRLCVYTPYIYGCDKWKISNKKQKRSIFINSGTVYPVEILTVIGGVDERFPLDALDHDTSIRVREAGYEIVCFTECVLKHTMGRPTKAKFLPIKANNYSAQRTYEITRCHVMNLRKHKKYVKMSYKVQIIRELIIMRLIRILLLEDQKVDKVRMLIKGIKSGLTAKI